ncbi:FAD/NAD(P)-binding protein [Lacticigenium naphthae]|uniref:FAD/NAD(P)-binding protein n=1 Tax=Lacticigenium naphthae TaxID=515351 RepID=UPI00146F5F07|nr:FAD/NAD(P)-binding protein [Lacticigenium naphthae]
MEKKVAIIGLGVSGLSVLREYICAQEHEDLEIIVFDEENLGTGLPYQKDDKSLLLNQTSATMSMDPINPLGFVDWLDETLEIQDASGHHIPRTIYGQYLRDYLNKLIQKGNITFVPKKVSDLTIIGENEYKVSCKNDSYKVNAIHLCTGHFPYKDPYGLKGKTEYIHQPYPVESRLFPLLGKDVNRLAIVGTGLTALDIMLYVSKTNKDIQIHFISLDGAFTSVRGNIVFSKLHYLNKENISNYIDSYGDFIPLNQYIEWLMLEGESNGIDVREIWQNLGGGTPKGIEMDFRFLNELGIFQGIIHQLDDILPLIWDSLTNDDRNTFLRMYGGKWHKFRSPMPQKTAKKILELCADESIILHKNIQSINYIGNSFEINLPTEQLHVEYIVNATGPETDVEKAKLQDPFLFSLLNKRIVEKQMYGGIEVEWPSQSVYSSKYGVLNTLKAHGQLVGGIQYGNNSMGMLSRSAVMAVEHAFKFIKEEETNGIKNI